MGAGAGGGAQAAGVGVDPTCEPAAGSRGLSGGLCARKGGHGWGDKGVGWGFWVGRRMVWAWEGPLTGMVWSKGT